MAARDRSPDTVEVARFRYRYEAEMVAGRLEDAGIPAFVFGDDIGGMYPGVASVGVRVAAEDVERAREALEDSDEPAD